MSVEPDVSPGASVAVAPAERAGRLTRWAGRHRLRLAVLALVLAQAVWRVVLLSGSWFGGDDFLYASRASRLGLSWEQLVGKHGGQLMPGGFLLVWLDTALAPLDWDLVVAQTALLGVLAGLAVWHMLRTVFGARPVLLAPLALYLLSPLTLPAANWYAAGLNALPLQIALPMAVAAQVRYARTLRARDALVTAAWVAFGLLFFVKAVLLPPLLFALTGALGFAGTRHVSWRVVLVRHRRAWALQAGLLGAYAVLYVLTPVAAPSAGLHVPRSGAAVADLFANGLGRVLAPGVLGGPWRWFPTEAPTALALPPFLAVWLSAVVVLAAVLGACVARRRAAWAWACVLGYGCACLTVIAFARLNLLNGVLGLETHYLADCAPLVVLAMTFSLLPVAGEAGPVLDVSRLHLPARLLRSGGTTVLAGVLVLATSSVFSVHAFQQQRLSREPGRHFLENARAALAAAPDDLALYDRRAPDSLLTPLIVEGGQISDVLAPVMPERLGDRPFAAPVSEAPQAFDADGRLHPVGVDGVEARRGPDACGWVVDGTSAFVPLRSELFDYDWTVRVGYVSSRPSLARVTFGRTTVDVLLRAGVGQFVFPAEGSSDRVRFDVPKGTSLCVGDVQVGNLVLLP